MLIGRTGTYCTSWHVQASSTDRGWFNDNHWRSRSRDGTKRPGRSAGQLLGCAGRRRGLNRKEESPEYL